jgi:hypothetical protein
MDITGQRARTTILIIVFIYQPLRGMRPNKRRIMTTKIAPLSQVLLYNSNTTVVVWNGMLGNKMLEMKILH